MGKLSIGKLAEDLELPNADRFRKKVAGKPISALAMSVSGVVSAQPAVVGVLAFNREDARVGQFLLKQKIGGCRGMARLKLSRSTYGKQVLVAIKCRSDSSQLPYPKNRSGCERLR